MHVINLNQQRPTKCVIGDYWLIPNAGIVLPQHNRICMRLSFEYGAITKHEILMECVMWLPRVGCS